MNNKTKMSPLTKNLLKPIFILAACVYVPYTILSDLLGSFLGQRNKIILGNETSFDKLGNEIFS